jgi:hypothetical protein
MDDKLNAQTRGKREIVNKLDREFARLHFNSCAVVDSTPGELLYRSPPQAEAIFSRLRSNSPSSVGEAILRSAAVIEQTFGGITASLWDDPFEWTLPEYLSTPARVIEHLTDVEAIRQRAFSSFEDDACLLKHVVMPSEQSRSLDELLKETLRRASDHQAYALAVLKSLSGISPPGFII